MVARGVFSLGGPPLKQKTSIMQILGTPVFDTHLELLKIALTLLSTDVPNLEILPIGDI